MSKEDSVRKAIWTLSAMAFALAIITPQTASAQNCVKIQSGTLVAGDGTPITTGFDKWGYNYQAHMFNGLYENYSRPPIVSTGGTENLVMKWSDNWLANVSCDNSGKLARGYNAKTGTVAGFSMGWVTNHFEGEYEGSDGELHHYTYFAKIVYDGGAACNTAGDTTCRWGLYAIVEELQNDQFGEYGGRMKFINKLTGPGLGRF